MNATTELTTNAGVFTINCLYCTDAYVGYSANIASGVETIFNQLEHDRHRSKDFKMLWDDFGRDGFIVRVMLETDDRQEAETFKERLIASGRYPLNRRKVESDIALVERFVTPWGTYDRASMADYHAPVISFYEKNVYRACYNPDAVITEDDFRSNTYLAFVLDQSVIGKTWGSIGFGIEQSLVATASVKKPVPPWEYATNRN